MLTASVIICAYTAERQFETLGAVASVQSQRPAPHEIILVVDHNPQLQFTLTDPLPDVTRARDLLGWEPRVGLDEGLARFGAWLHPLLRAREPGAV